MTESRKLIFSSLCLALAFAMGLAFPGSAFAATASSILVDISPPNPAPLEEVTITLSSYAYSLDSVLISWSVDGKKGLSGIGEKSFILQAPAAGKETSVSAAIALPDGSIERRIVIRPSVMVLLWQANDSYVPPFYKGKALPTLESEIKIVAMPEVRASGGMVSSRNMTYDWKKDYSNDQAASGYGKNFYLYTSDYLEDTNTVSVVAATTDQRYQSEGSISVEASEPEILFYKNDSRLGTIWEKALPDLYSITGATVFEAAPYFLSPKELQHPLLLWKWYINGSAVNNQNIQKNLMPVQPESGASGTAKLRVEIENKYKIFQTVNKEINIQF